MKNIFMRTKQFAWYLLDNNATIRQTAKAFSIAKSTVHYDLQNRLKIIDPALYCQVANLLEENFKQKSIRGGLATKQKYLSMQPNLKSEKVQTKNNPIWDCCSKASN